MATTVQAVCILRNDSEQVYGLVHFQQSLSSPDATRVYGTIKGLKAGFHGFHLHTFGDLSNGCDSAGPHFNPFGQDHGSLDSPVRHIGDFGNLESRGSDQDVSFDFVVPQLTLLGPYSIIGRSVIIHADRDDLGLTSHPLSKTTGNSGARLVCGVIGLAKSK